MSAVSGRGRIPGDSGAPESADAGSTGTERSRMEACLEEGALDATAFVRCGRRVRQ
jgi:hypothetical protein